MGYRIGLDIGIGSVGWCVISGSRDESKIEDFGVRIFDSGEKSNGKDRKSQERRGFRGARRLIRRRGYRRMAVKNHLINIGLLDSEFYEKYEFVRDADVHELKVKGLDERLSPEELYKCIIHFCNHRGYKSFYDLDPEDENKDEEEGLIKEAVAHFGKVFKDSGCRTVSEYFVKNRDEKGKVEFRNRDSRKENGYTIIERSYLRDELEAIIKKQQEYYECLKGRNGDFVIEAVFRQRIFEEGPGDSNNPYRRYTGFLESLGQCPFYVDEKRGFRNTVISDVFAVVNTLSQYRYTNKDTGEIGFSRELSKALIDNLFKEANLTLKDVKKICKDYGYIVVNNGNSDPNALRKSIKFLGVAKASAEKAGEDWEKLISEEQLDLEHPSMLHKIGVLLSSYQTPSKRREEFRKIDNLSESFKKELSGKKLSGTSAASYKYMLEAIEAFMNGEIYGNFQSTFLENQKIVVNVEKSRKLLPKHIDDEDVKDNPVVFRAINETRKVLNAIISIYGSPEIINVEVASDLNRSFEERMKILKEQKNREKENDRIRGDIAKLLNIDEQEVSGRQMDAYKLYEIQEGKSLYSVEPLGDIIDVLDDKSHKYEIDHIIPYSLILDNTLNNKALVYASENQFKGQKTPLMYLKGDDSKKFTEFVNALYLKKKGGISDRKYKYLMQETLYGSEAMELLDAWKSRNINDTRYITKYIVALLEGRLVFSGNRKKHVFGIKGGLTSKFRKIWLKGSEWGDEEKKRDNYLNHAVDAIIVANLTPAYIEIASDNIKLQQIFRRNQKRKTSVYYDYMERCCEKMDKYYHFSKDYTQRLLESKAQVPAYLPRIREEVVLRICDDKEKLAQCVREFYGENADFVVEPHVPIASIKPERRFRGAIADNNPIRVAFIDGEPHKISRKAIKDVSAKDLEFICGNDIDLKKTLGRILSEREAKYTIGDYLIENGLDKFVTDGGKSVYKVSIFDKRKISNYYRKDISEHNYSVLGVLKYYCVEVYKNINGDTCVWGIRYVDLVRSDKKLLLKKSALPGDYKEHILYMFTNDVISIYKKDGSIKFNGYYNSVYNINENRFYVSSYNDNSAKKKDKSISKSDTVKKYAVSILGEIGGEIKCSEPLSLTTEK